MTTTPAKYIYIECNNTDLRDVRLRLARTRALCLINFIVLPLTHTERPKSQAMQKVLYYPQFKSLKKYW